eukprot:scaffold236462_cov17-Tisochrysis_lutea.AAC.1
MVSDWQEAGFKTFDKSTPAYMPDKAVIWQKKCSFQVVDLGTWSQTVKSRFIRRTFLEMYPPMNESGNGTTIIAWHNHPCYCQTHAPSVVACQLTRINWRSAACNALYPLTLAENGKMRAIRSLCEKHVGSMSHPGLGAAGFHCHECTRASQLLSESLECSCTCKSSNCRKAVLAECIFDSPSSSTRMKPEARKRPSSKNKRPRSEAPDGDPLDLRQGSVSLRPWEHSTQEQLQQQVDAGAGQRSS